MNNHFFTGRIAFCGLLTALALILSLIERMFPLTAMIPVPGLKLGLANVVTLFALARLDKRCASAILFCRISLAAMLGGGLTGLLFSLMGGFSALGVMALLMKAGNRWFSLIGISIAGAAAHDVGQIFAAVFVTGTWNVAAYLPMLLVLAVPLGFVTGMSVSVILPYLDNVSLEMIEKSRPM